MKPLFLHLSCAAFVAAAFVARAADEWVLPPEKVQVKEGKGAELATANCLMCHSVDYISMQPSFTREQWKASVTKMQQKFGAPIPAEQMEPLIDYLTANYGKARPAVAR
jgi:hypothetical protein